MNRKSKTFALFLKAVFVFFFIFVFQAETSAQGVKRVVIVKVDGLSGDFVDTLVKQRDPATGKSMLPWFEEIFYKRGTRLANFYTRGMSLSGPSWSLLDTGQHLQIKGNVEFDRLTLRSYDYLNFFPFYVDYGLGKRADMPGVELLDQLKQPLLYDAFAYERRYISYQLYQRGNEWEIFAGGFVNLFPRAPRDFIDEWTMGFDFLNLTVKQNERDIVNKLGKRPEIDYFDYYTAHLDHVSHNNKDMKSRRVAVQELDRTIGHIWNAIRASPRADETALFVVSDHGFNSDEKVYSQGFNLVKLFAGANGGGHHVITKRRLMMDYSVKSVYPFVPLITTASDDSYYLKGESGDYPTALVDFDGNERSSIHLRNSDLNVLHILLQQLQSGKLSPEMQKAATNAFFDVLNRRRETWQKNAAELSEELGALRRWIEAQRPIIENRQKKFTDEETAKGLDKAARRAFAQFNIAVKDELDYREYLQILSNLLALNRDSFNPKKIEIKSYIPKGAMGERNSVYQLQNYVVGLSLRGLTADAGGDLDFEKSFRRVNYFDLLHGQTVRNNVQPGISNRPVDFVAVDIPLDSISAALPPDLKPDENPIWLYGGAGRQALVLTRKSENGNQLLRYLPVAHLTQRADGTISFETKEWDAGFPLKIFEDANFIVPGSNRKAWLGGWHAEIEWLRATHKTFYSSAVINLGEQFKEHRLIGFENEGKELAGDEKLMHRFRWRQRRLTETDLLIHASNHWNFDVRGFNPGGNHGSLFRVSSNSTLMMAGGADTNIPRGLLIEEPYDNLSFVPTVLALMGKINEGSEPLPDLYERGFKRFPGRIIREVMPPQGN